MNTYQVIQKFDDGDAVYPSYGLSINAETPEEAVEIAKHDDKQYPRNQGWTDADVMMVGWVTGEFPKKGILV